MITKFLTAAAATAMVAAPVAASAAPAASLSVAKSARASAPTTGANKAVPGGSAIAIVLGALVAGGIIYAVVDSTDDNDSDSN
jgi:hypothetical protein